MAQLSPVMFDNNSMKDIRSHSTTLFNNRLAVLFMDRDIYFTRLFSDRYNPRHLKDAYSICHMIYLNIRPLVYNHPVLRTSLNLETSKKGIYVPDVAFALVERMIDECELEGYDRRKIFIMRETLKQVDQICMNILQFLNYFIRPNIKNRPDVMEITDVYKHKVDKLTVEEMRRLVGRSDNTLALDHFENVPVDKFDSMTKDHLLEESEVFDDEEEVDEEIDEFNGYKPGTYEDDDEN